MPELTKKEIDTLKVKAEKWDKLHKEIAEFYEDENGDYSEENPVREGDLTDIGEVAAMAFGFM